MRLTALTILVITLCGCSPSDDAPPADTTNMSSVDSIAHTYKTLQLITPKRVYVNPELAMLCRGATRAEVEAARKKDGIHANAAITIYMNDLAADSFKKSLARYPVGSIIVKEKDFLGYRSGNGDWAGTGAGVGGMVKRPAGFDPDHRDWEYFYFEDPRKVESGKIASCVSCHAGAATTDHVFGTWAKPVETR